jgi:hypothetical protein
MDLRPEAEGLLVRVQPGEPEGPLTSSFEVRGPFGSLAVSRSVPHARLPSVSWLSQELRTTVYLPAARAARPVGAAAAARRAP